MYYLFIKCYHLLLHLASPFHAKARQWVRGRRGWRSALTNWRRSVAGERPLIWMHCASLGEFEQGRPVLEGLRGQYPDAALVLTFFSPSGYEQRKSYAGADYVAYLPPDGPGNARFWLDTLRPDLAIFVKYEFWYYHLRALQQRGTPTLLIAAQLRPRQLSLPGYGGLLLRLLQGFDHIFAQTEASQALLRQKGLQRLSLAGDPRVDRVAAIAEEATDYPLIQQFAEGFHLLIAGSSWEADEKLLSSLSQQPAWPADWKMLIAPHRTDESHVADLLQRLPPNTLRYSTAPGEAELRRARLLVLDTIGMLSQVYRYGRLAYIGGGFGAGIHNTLEPIAHGLPVIFGPRHGKFPEAEALLVTGGGFCVRDETELASVFTDLLSEDRYTKASRAALGYIDRQRGSTEKILAWIGDNWSSDRITSSKKLKS